jgi:hypothetical protein
MSMRSAKRSGLCVGLLALLAVPLTLRAAKQEADAAKAAKQEMLKSAETAYHAYTAAHEAGTVGFEHLPAWSKRWMDAQLRVANTEDERRQARVDHLARMTTEFRKVEALSAAGARGGEMTLLESARYHAAEAKLLLAEADEAK